MSLITDFVGNAELFPVLGRWDFFNHAGVAPIPRASADAIRKFASEAEGGAYLETSWYRDINALRMTAAKMINASAEEIAFTKNTSEGLSIVANGVDWHAGDRIVTTAVEYPANIYPWMELQWKFGVELVLVQEETREDGSRWVPLNKILAAADHPKTRMVTLSHVEFGSGQRHDLAAVGSFCRGLNILFCVDAIQTLGVLPVDVKGMNIDYLSADGHKWLLGPEGAGIFYCRKELIEQTRPATIGWMNVVNAQDFGTIDFTLKPNAARYECGSWNVAGLLGLKPSLEMLAMLGAGAVSQRVKAITDRLISGLQDKGYAVVSPRNAMHWSGIVSFTSAGKDYEQIAKVLLKEHRAEIAVRVGRMRASPHFYNTEAQIDRLIEHLPG